MSPRASRMRQPHEVEFEDEGCVAHRCFKAPGRGKPWQVEVRFYGRVTIDGEEYEWNQVVDAVLTKTVNKESQSSHEQETLAKNTREIGL
jgi:hypothetical protein